MAQQFPFGVNAPTAQSAYAHLANPFSMPPNPPWIRGNRHDDDDDEDDDDGDDDGDDDDDVDDDAGVGDADVEHYDDDVDDY